MKPCLRLDWGLGFVGWGVEEGCGAKKRCGEGVCSGMALWTLRLCGDCVLAGEW